MGSSLRYRVRVRGRLGTAGVAWFEDLSVSAAPGGDTLIVGSLPDQSALHGVLARVRDLGLELISVEELDPIDPVESTLEV